MKNQYAKRVDANHQQIGDFLRKLGAVVHDTSRLGGGFGDYLIAVGGVTVVVEVKDGAKPKSARKLTPAEEKFAAYWQTGGMYAVVESEEQAASLVAQLAAMTFDVDDLKGMTLQ